MARVPRFPINEVYFVSKPSSMSRIPINEVYFVSINEVYCVSKHVKNVTPYLL